MTQEQIKHGEEFLDERYAIYKNFNNKPDLTYYQGALDMLSSLGLEWKRLEDGTHKIYRR